MVCAGCGSRQCQTKSNIAVQNVQSFTISALLIRHTMANSAHTESQNCDIPSVVVLVHCNSNEHCLFTSQTHTPCDALHRSVLFLSRYCTAYSNHIFVLSPPMSLPLQMAASLIEQR